MSLTNPFAKQNPKKQIQSTPVPKVDSTRENVKKTLINALEKQKDNLIQGLKKTSEQIAIEIEQEVYEQNDNSSKSRSYRDKIRKLEMRIKGMRNNHIREILKKEIISVKDFCNLNEKELNDDNYFKNLLNNELGNNNTNDNNKAVLDDKKNKGDISKTTKIIKPLNMPRNIRPAIPKPIIPPPIKIEKEIENEKNNINTEIKKEEEKEIKPEIKH